MSETESAKCAAQAQLPDSERAPPAQLPAPRAPVPGEGRKLLPSIPASDPGAMAAPRPGGKAAAPPSPSSNGYGPFFQEYTLMAEYARLPNQKLPGIYVLPSYKSPLVWNGVLFIREGIYQDGVFRFYMTVPENYPDADAPTFKFEFPIFHPMVNPETGEIDVKRAFPNWRKNVHHLSAVLLYARRIFYKIETTMPLNPEAAVLYERAPDLFQERVTESIQQACSRVVQPPTSEDPYAIRLNSWDPPIHEPAHQQMLNSKRGPSEERSAREAGLSWMKAGSTQIFSRDDSTSA